MKKTRKYVYPEFILNKNRTWPDKKIECSPVWCSVDLRDGNQALPVPMNPKKKLNYFKTLCLIGFKEIEVGFPSASQDDFDFVRELITCNYIPDDVRISVLTQARKHLIDRTVESLHGVSKAIVHCYVATSDLHSSIVFGKTRKEVLKMAIDGTKDIISALEKAGMQKNVGLEFSPEEFTDSDINFVIEVCEAVKEAWGSSLKSDFILNLPATVERRPPYQYADMIEYFCSKYKYLKETTISLHAHNDQGCAVAATEMALLAGGERVEGTLFGHGERTGNLDIVILALNLHSRGIETGLNFSDMNSIVRIVESSSGIDVHRRHPYAGDLVFTAFSGSHQDAIRKGIKEKKKAEELFGVSWKIPYLHIDPSDIGRKYERLIRINSQSGKGGAVYVLENEFGYTPPKKMHPEIGEEVQKLADKVKKEVSAYDLVALFKEKFFNLKGAYELEKIKIIPDPSAPDKVKAKMTVSIKGKKHDIEGEGNGPVSAAVHALKSNKGVFNFILEDFTEQALGISADATAVAYVGIRPDESEKVYYGAGEHSNIEYAAILAVFSALNRASQGVKK